MRNPSNGEWQLDGSCNRQTGFFNAHDHQRRSFYPSPARRAPARRWRRRSSPPSSGSTCTASTSPRWSASTSARPRRTSSRSSPRAEDGTPCCSSTRPTRSSAGAPRSATPTTATPTPTPTTCCRHRVVPRHRAAGDQPKGNIDAASCGGCGSARLPAAGRRAARVALGRLVGAHGGGGRGRTAAVAGAGGGVRAPERRSSTRCSRGLRGEAGGARSRAASDLGPGARAVKEGRSRGDRDRERLLAP